MQLVVNKSQSKGLMGGTSFEVRAQVRLTQEEQQLVQHYRLENAVLLHKKLVNIWGQPTDVNLEIKTRQLLSGEIFKCKDLEEVLAYRDSLKTACESLKAYLAVARAFQGQEVYEF